MAKLKIMILSDSSNYANSQILEKAKARGHQAEIVSPNDFVLNFDRSGQAQMYVRDERLEGTPFDAVIPRLGTNRKYGIFILRYLINRQRLFSTADPDGLVIAADKLRTAMALCDAKLPIPKTTTIRKPDNFDFLIETVGGLPSILKMHYGSQGNGVFILNDKLQSSVTLSNLRKANFDLLLQQFITTAQDDEKKSDIRCWVVGGKVAAAFKRYSTDADFRSNYSLSGEGEKVTITKQEEELAVRAAAVLKLSCCGVDIARDLKNEGYPVIYEVNGCADLRGIERVTGISVADKIIDFVESNLSMTKPLNPANYTRNAYFGNANQKARNKKEMQESEFEEMQETRIFNELFKKKTL